MTQGEAWVPAFPGQRPPFEPANQWRVKEGNTLALRHGAYSPAVIAPRAAEIVEQFESNPEVAELVAVDRPMFVMWARALVAYERAQAHVEALQEAAENGVGDLGDKRVLAAYALLDRTQGRLSNLTSRLGFDPLSRARLGRDKAGARALDAATELTKWREQHERTTGARVIDGE